MTMTQWLAGASGQFLSSSGVIIIHVLMLMMAAKLYASYRNKQIYRLLIGALILVMVQQLALIYLAAPGSSPAEWLYLGSVLLQQLSLIIINFVFMKLYTYRSAQLKNAPFLLMGAASGAAAALQIALFPLDAVAAAGPQPYTFPVLDLYGLLVVFMLLLGTRTVEISSKYFASLTVYFAGELLRLADGYVFHGALSWLTAAGRLLPIIYSGLLFILLFEWVIERLMSTYQSSIMDGLTGLYNRRHFHSKADQLLRRSKSMAVIFCDIDNFKKLNDTQGHHKADVVLKQVAEIIKEEAAGIGAAGRYGGEELLACIGTDRVKPEVVAESIRRRVEQETIVTISVGFSTRKEAGTVQDMVKQADEAMYYSKQNGKNRVTAFKSLTSSKKQKQESYSY